MAKIKQHIALNFIPLVNQKFSFPVYRRLTEPQEESWDKNIRSYNLPKNDKSEKYKKYWVSFSKFDGAEKFTVTQNTNNDLTKWLLNEQLFNSAENTSSVHLFKKEDSFRRLRLHFQTGQFTEGTRTVWLEPYLLKEKGEFGYLIGFKFFLENNQPFNKRVQELSFSIDKDGKSNRNYHIDVVHYIYKFMKEGLASLNPISDTISLADKFTSIESGLLSTKQYLFQKGNTANSQFNGIMRYGPYEKIEANIHYILLFREEEKSYMVELLKALNGDAYQTFKGMDRFGLHKINPKENVQALRISDFSSEEIDRAFSAIKTRENSIILSVFPGEQEEFYYSLKNKALQEDILLQVVHKETIYNEYVFKWSVGSIALQIFAKLGGTPWLVQSKTEDTLMIGIGNSISKNSKTGKIERFYAYSVLIESTGKFKSINSLGNHSNREAYLKEIAQNIRTILEENKQYKKIVFHLPHKIKNSEIEVIKEVIQDTQNVVIALIKINDGSKFFGFNKEQNSLVPYESTFAKLSNKEFLIWTEGLNFHSNKATKRYAHPLSIDFLYSTNDELDYDEYLQEILNLSGANFRGFNAKALPVSLFYPKLISEFNRSFKEFNLEQVFKDNSKPWFL